jgi:hypothetical protein
MVAARRERSRIGPLLPTHIAQVNNHKESVLTTGLELGLSWNSCGLMRTSGFCYSISFPLLRYAATGEVVRGPATERAWKVFCGY